VKVGENKTTEYIIKYIITPNFSEIAPAVTKPTLLTDYDDATAGQQKSL
jgi:hypothetical protein